MQSGGNNERLAKETDVDAHLLNMKLEKENQRLKRENTRQYEEIKRLDDLIHQMKNIDDDELLMIEKVQTKEIYGKAQKVKFSDLQKETERIRIEINRLKVIIKTKDQEISNKDKQVRSYREENNTEIRRFREENERLKKAVATTNVVYKTEYKTNPEIIKELKVKDYLLKQKDEEIRMLKNLPAKIHTVIFEFFKDL